MKKSICVVLIMCAVFANSRATLDEALPEIDIHSPFLAEALREFPGTYVRGRREVCLITADRDDIHTEDCGQYCRKKGFPKSKCNPLGICRCS